MTNLRFGAIALLICGLVSGCGNSGSVATGTTQTSPALTAAIGAECASLGKAFELSGRSQKSIIEGCPGYENVVVASGGVAGAGSFLSAATAALPNGVQADPTATRLYQRMIARGVPSGVAAKVAQTPEFASAVEAAKKL